MDDNGKPDRVKGAESLMRSFMRWYDIGPEMALCHLQSWAPDLSDAYYERLDSDESFRARFEHRVRRHRARRIKTMHENDPDA